MVGLYDSAANFDRNAVSIPVTGIIAFHPVVSKENVIADEEMGSKTLTLSSGWRPLGLMKSDGGVEEGRDDEDATEFFQEGEKIAGASTRTIKVGLAENGMNVQRFLEGKDPDTNGVVYVDDSLPDAKFLVFSATRFKNGTEERRTGVGRIKAIEVDQETRGEVRAKSVTIEWVPSDLFKGKPYKRWTGVPGGVVIKLDKMTASVKENETVQLIATVEPDGQEIAWKSSDPLTATVEGGLVTGVKTGGPITITASAGGSSATCAVTVTSAD